MRPGATRRQQNQVNEQTRDCKQLSGMRRSSQEVADKLLDHLNSCQAAQAAGAARITNFAAPHQEDERAECMRRERHQARAHARTVRVRCVAGGRIILLSRALQVQMTPPTPPLPSRQEQLASGWSG